MHDDIDLSDTIIAKSDQLNADDLLGGPVTVEVTDVRKLSEDQPIALFISGGYQPWKPCKSMRRLLVAVWGAKGRDYVGRSLTLYRDADVMFGGVKVGGIRVSHMSHIDREHRVMLTSTRGKKAAHVVKPLRVERPRQDQPPSLAAVLESAGLTIAACDAWLASQGKPPASTGDEAAQARLAGWLTAKPERLDTLRQFMPQTQPEIPTEPSDQDF